MPTPPQECRQLATVLTDGTWCRALDLAATLPSPLKSTLGGAGSVGTHSDPTAAAALTRRHFAGLPSPMVLDAHLRIVAFELHAHPTPGAVAGQLKRAAEQPPVSAPLLVAVQAALRAVDALICTPAAAAFMLGKEDERRERVEKRAKATECAACRTPAHHCGRIRNGWCDSCYSLSRIWVQSRPKLVNDDLALDWQRFNDAVARAVADGEIHRAHSPIRDAS